MPVEVENKRRFPRIGLQAPLHCTIRGNGKTMDVLTEDISEGGLRFINPGFIAPNTHLMLNLNILSRTLNPIARVAWSNTMRHSYRCEVGVEFVGLDEKERVFLNDYISMRRSYS